MPRCRGSTWGVSKWLTFSVFNLLTLIGMRSTECSVAFAQHDIVFLLGTGLVQFAQHDSCVLMRLPKHRAYRFPRPLHPAKKFANVRAHGCAIMVFNRVPEDMITHVSAQDDKHVIGRAGAIRIIDGLQDILCAVIYFPLPTCLLFATIVKKMISWLQNFMSHMKSRTTPWIGVDLNENVGPQRVESGWIYSTSDFIGPHGRGREGFNAKNLRDVIDKFGLYFTTSFRNCGGTFWSGVGPCTRIDFSLSDANGFNAITYIGVSKKFARIVKHIPDAQGRLRDHAPRVARTNLRPAVRTDLPERTEWDWSKITRAWRVPGPERTAFLNDFEHAVASKIAISKQHTQHFTADRMWTDINSIMRDCAKRDLEASQQPSGLLCKQHCVDYRNGLQQRAALPRSWHSV